MNKKNLRESGIELLKVFALILIAFSHAMPNYSENLAGYMDLHFATDSIQRLIIVCYRYCGGIGNAIFIVCTSWFMVGNTKLKLSKLINIAIDTFIVSVLFLLISVLFGIKLSLDDILIQFFPLTFQTNWFVCCYIMFCIINPAINIVITRMNRKQHFCVSSTMFILYCCIGLLHEDIFYYTRLAGFITIYILVSYIKIYGSSFVEDVKKNILLLCSMLVLLVCIIVGTNIIGLKIPFMTDKLTHWASFKNPLVIFIAISAFNICKHFTFKNSIINYLSSTSLLFYLIHENYILANYIRGKFFSYIYITFTYKYELAWVTLMAIFLIILGFVGGGIYKQTIQKLSNKLAIWCYKRCRLVYEKLPLNSNANS